MNIEAYIAAIKSNKGIDKWHTVNKLTEEQLRQFEDNGLRFELTEETEPYPFQYKIIRL